MSKRTIHNVGIILACSIVARILSYIWEATLAATYGATDDTDALYMTSGIFFVVYPILDLGIWKVFLPIYKTKLVEKKDDLADQIANTAMTFFFILSFALLLLIIVCARPVVAMMAPGFSPEKKAVTVQYLRIASPYLIVVTLTSVIGAMLQSRERFLGSQVREIGTHISKIAYLCIFYRFLGIYAAVTSLIVGSIFRLLVQLPFINWKWKLRLNFNFRDKDFVPMIKGLPSVALTAAIQHINGMVDKVFASVSSSGSVACLNYGHRLLNVFSGMISYAVSAAVYPTMIQYIAQKQEDKLRELLKNVIFSLGFFIIPISCFCIFFSHNIVTVAFQRGAFDANATLLTSGVFTGYCIGMFFIGVSSVVTNVFYGYGDTKITLYISLMGIVINIVLDYMLIRLWGIVGLAMATSFSYIISLGIRFYLLKKFITVDYKSIGLELTKILGISIISCCVSFALFTKVPFSNAYILLFLNAGLFGIGYLLLAFLLKVKTLIIVENLVKSKVMPHLDKYLSKFGIRKKNDDKKQ